MLLLVSMPIMVKELVQLFLMMSVAQEMRADSLVALMIATLLTVTILRMLVFTVMTHVSNMIVYQRYSMVLCDVLLYKCKVIVTSA